MDFGCCHGLLLCFELRAGFAENGQKSRGRGSSLSLLQLAGQGGDFVGVADLAKRVHGRAAVGDENDSAADLDEHELLARRDGGAGENLHNSPAAAGGLQAKEFFSGEANDENTADDDAEGADDSKDARIGADEGRGSAAAL